MFNEARKGVRSLNRQRELQVNTNTENKYIYINNDAFQESWFRVCLCRNRKKQHT